MSLETFMHINVYLPLVAFGWLMFRTVEAWPAEWAKPGHQWHYRAVLVLLSIYVLLTTVATWARERMGDPASIASPALTVQTCLVLLLCWRWPPRNARSRQ